MATNYRELLEELRIEETRLQSDLEAIRGMISGAEVMLRRTSLPLFASTPTPKQEAGRRFEGMGVRQAIIRMLADSLKPLMPSEIAISLRSGGVDSRSNDFPGLVSSTLTQLRQESIIDRKEEGWVIAMRPDPLGNPPGSVSETDPTWVKISNALKQPSVQ